MIKILQQKFKQVFFVILCSKYVDNRFLSKNNCLKIAKYFIKNKQMEISFINEVFEKYQDEKNILFNKINKTKNGVKLKI